MVSWVTVVWSMIAGACLTLAAIYGVIWYRNRTDWARMFFAVMSAATAGLACTELWLMRAETPAQFLAALSWGHVPLFVWLVSIVWFVRIYLRAGRLWLAWIICVLRLVVVVANVVLGQDTTFRNITNLRHIDFLGESVAVLGGVPNPVTPLAQVSSLLILIFVADASITAWRRGDRHKALMVGGSVEFFLIASLGTATAIIWGNSQAPMVFSVFYMVLVAVMGFELSRDVLRASQLVHELKLSAADLRESEARVSLAIEAGDFGIWIWDFSRNTIWASDSWRALHGFGPSEVIQFDAVMERVHPDDRESLRHTHVMAVEGGDSGRYQIEYRLTGPDGEMRWISSRGRVEHDAAGQPILIRGAAREVTAAKRAELAVRSLSGRILSAQEEERRRIARELHDNLSQQIALLAMEIDAVATSPGLSAVTLTRTMHGLRQRIGEISTEIHNLSHQLHSSKLEMLGLVAALRGHCQELQAQGIRAHLHNENVPRSLQRDVELCLFRVAQEGLNNVVKHSGTREAHVTLHVTDDVLTLSIADAGRGFDERSVSGAQSGLGLASMRERLRLIDGEFTIRSQPSQGTTITARVPISRAANRSITRVG